MNMVSIIKEDTSFRDREIARYRKEVFDKPLDKLTVTDFTRMTSFIKNELGYDIVAWIYIHEYMRQYVAIRRGKNSRLTGRSVYKYVKDIAPEYHDKLKREGKLTKEHATIFRDSGWKNIPEI